MRSVPHSVLAARPRLLHVGATVQRSTAILATTLCLTACVRETSIRGSSYCAPPVVPTPFPSDPPPPPGAPREERVAALLGVSALLVEGTPDQETRMNLLARVEEARLVIAGTRAELDCAGERARQQADYLSNANQSAFHLLTVGSIAAAAVTSIVSVFLSTAKTSAWTQNGFAIGGGVVTAGLGVASLYVDGRIRIELTRNLLADVWFGPKESSVYPPVVWGYFTQPGFSNDQQRPIRENMIERWMHFQRIQQSDRETVTLLFGSGGMYDEDALRMRASMIDQVKAEVDLMNQDIAALARRILGRPTRPRAEPRPAISPQAP